METLMYLFNDWFLLPTEALFNLNASDGRIFFPFGQKEVIFKGIALSSSSVRG
jgi:hypothetical protein